MYEKTLFAKTFQNIYKGLNDQQKVAVDTIEGPVMVIAGPGTGKTQILSARIGKILLETDAQPENILCLTYTDAGVVAMRKRLLNFIGSDAYKVNIHTFHSFCNGVIQENTRHFKKDLQPLTDLERIQVMEELIDAFPNDHLLKRFKGEVYYDLDNLCSLYSAIKREGWKPEWLEEKIDEYVQNHIPETDGYYNKREKAKGNYILTQKGKDEVERMQRVKAAIGTYESYQKSLEKKKRYDFDDMINWVIDQFETNHDLLLNYQEQLQYILVDEYQDTSGSQNKIVELLISHWADEKPNIFVVGDDDQSIYRFQGANLKNMMNLATTYANDLQKVVLTKNYRSVQPILNSARFLIENNEQRLVNQYKDLTKELITANASLIDLQIMPEVRIYENEFAENVHVTSSVKALIDSGVKAGNIAIIYKEHKCGDELLKFMQLQQIPFYVKRSINLLQDVFINRILNIIRYVSSELDMPFSGEPLLFEIMHYGFFKISPFRIAAICNEIYEARNKKNLPSTLRAYLNNLKKERSTTLFATDDETQELLHLHQSLEDLQKAVHNKPVQQWFEMLINEAGILSYIFKAESKTWEMRKLSCLFDFIKEETHRRPELTLKQLIQHIDLMNDHEISIPLVQTTGTDTGVNLLTCHGSKGLEYEYVFMINCRNDVWEGKRKMNRGFRLPFNVFEQESEAEVVEELRRLFFVAVTRAEKHLYISYPQMKNDGKLMEPSQFIEELRQPMGIEPIPVPLSTEQQFDYAALRFGIVQKPVLEKSEADYITTLVSKFTLNVTALNNYLECPLKFYYTNLIKVPSAVNEAAQFGTAVHAAMSDFINAMMQNNKRYPDKGFLQQQFLFHINNGREVFTKESLRRFTDYGMQVLSRYYENYYLPAPINEFIVTEYPLTKVVVNDVPLKGFADKIQFWGNEIAVTDFKTGNLFKALRRFEFCKPGEREDKLQGGNYWRQAVFYKILVDNLPGKSWKVLYTQFDFIEPNPKDEFDLHRVEITQQDIATVKEQISFAWKEIQQHNFYTGCGKDDCHWCKFTKENKLYCELIEEAEMIERD